MTKKLLSFFITLTLLASFAAPLTGAADVAEDITAVGLTSNSDFVIVQSDSVLVASHSFNSAYQIDSDEVISALSSDNGYSLTYIDKEKNAPQNAVSHVRDGFIRCTKDSGEPIDVPIVDRGKISSSPTAMRGFQEIPPDTIVRNQTSGIANKASDDSAYLVTATNADITKEWRLDYNMHETTKDDGETSSNAGLEQYPNESFVVEGNFYLDGNMGMALYMRAYKFLEINSAGEIYAINKAESELTNSEYSTKDFTTHSEKLGKVEPGKWHRVAVGYDINIKSDNSNVGQIYVYIDGKLITLQGSQSLTNYSVVDTFRFCTAIGNAVTGKLAVDDVISYEGYYYPERNAVDISDYNDGDLIIDSASKSIKYNSDFYTSDNALKQIIKSQSDNTARIVFLKSDNTPASNLSEATQCMVEAECDGNVLVYDYYKLEKFFEIKDFAFTQNGAAAQVTEGLNQPKNITMVLVCYDSNGAVRKVISSDTISVQGTTKPISITTASAEDLTDAKVIFIDNWTSRMLIPGGIYNQQ